MITSTSTCAGFHFSHLSKISNLTSATFHVKNVVFVYPNTHNVFITNLIFYCIHVACNYRTPTHNYSRLCFAPKPSRIVHIHSISNYKDFY